MWPITGTGNARNASDSLSANELLPLPDGWTAMPMLGSESTGNEPPLIWLPVHYRSVGLIAIAASAAHLWQYALGLHADVRARAR